MNLRDKPPCYSCDHHTEACHATCEAYLGWAEARRAARDARWQQNQGGREAQSRQMDMCIKQKRRRERG